MYYVLGIMAMQMSAYIYTCVCLCICIYVYVYICIYIGMYVWVYDCVSYNICIYCILGITAIVLLPGKKTAPNGGVDIVASDLTGQGKLYKLAGHLKLNPPPVSFSILVRVDQVLRGGEEKLTLVI